MTADIHPRFQLACNIVLLILIMPSALGPFVLFVLFLMSNYFLLADTYPASAASVPLGAAEGQSSDIDHLQLPSFLEVNSSSSSQLQQDPDSPSIESQRCWDASDSRYLRLESASCTKILDALKYSSRSSIPQAWATSQAYNFHSRGSVCDISLRAFPRPPHKQMYMNPIQIAKLADQLLHTCVDHSVHGRGGMMGFGIGGDRGYLTVLAVRPHQLQVATGNFTAATE